MKGTGHGWHGRAGWFGLLAAWLLALSSAQASERNGFVRQLELEISQFDGRIDALWGGNWAGKLGTEVQGKPGGPCISIPCQTPVPISLAAGAW